MHRIILHLVYSVNSVQSLASFGRPSGATLPTVRGDHRSAGQAPRPTTETRRYSEKSRCARDYYDCQTSQSERQSGQSG